MEASVMVAIVIAIVINVLNARKKQKAQQDKKRPVERSAARTPTVPLHRPAPSMEQRPSAPVRSYNQAGLDHFARDKARRIAQLDEWLRNGLIDKAEYNVLKDRFQRGV